MSARQHQIVVAACLLALIALSSCGGSAGGGPSTVTKTVTDGAITVGAYDLYFDVHTIDTSPGPLTVTLVDHGAVFHTFKIEGTSLYLQTNAGQTATGTVTLAKGTYTFDCTVPGHAAAGMRGVIHVR